MAEVGGKSSDEQFDDLQNQYYSTWFRYHPERGVDAGFGAVAHQLRSYDEDDIGALLALDKKLLFALAEMNIEDLDERRQVDYRIMLGATEIEIRDQEEHDWRYINPCDYLPIKAVHQLLIHPTDNVHKALKKRLESFEEHLRGAKLQLTQRPESVVPSWLDSAVEQCRTGSDFIRNLGRNPFIKRHFDNPQRLQPLYDAAANALEDFAHFLTEEISPKASGDFACGVERFNRLLKSRHFLGIDHSDLLRLGEKIFDETKQALNEHTQQMSRNADIDSIMSTIKAKHLKAEDILESYRKKMRAAHQWLIKSQLMTLPEHQSMKIQETPAFMRSLIPIAAYEAPAPSDPEQHGIYYVTVSDVDGLLAEHNEFSIDLTCVHEAFPGHHMQFVLANGHQGTNLIRTVNKSASMYEGWALYCEDLAVEQKYLTKKEHVFMMLRDRLWRALRIIIDVKIHTGQLSISEAVDLMIAELGLAREQAESELRWYSRLPTSPSCYAVGRELIIAARRYCLDDLGIDLKSFHDRLLAQGSIALPLAIHAAFGDSAWRSVHAEVFGQR